ncbi:hypothetical protein N8344_00790 [bacterium]|nr:hypothetical protein [bacterium]
MAINIVANLEANTKEAVRQVDKVNEKVKEVSRNAKKAGDDLTESMVIGNAAVKQVDKVTGGLASALVKVGKAATKSGKAMRVALLSTGIGAITIAVGLLVEYWDEITDLIGGSNKELEKQIILNSENLNAVDRKLRNIRTQIELEKKQGKNVDDLIEKEKSLVLEKRKALLDQIDAEKLRLKQIKDEAELATWREKQLLSNQRLVKAGGKAVSKITEEERIAINDQQTKLDNLINAYDSFELGEIVEPKKIKDTGETEAEKLAEQQRLKAIDDKASSIEEITKLEDDYLQSQLEKQTQEENAVYDKYFAQIQAAELYNISTTVLEEARQKELQVISDKYTEEAKDKEKKRLEDIQKIVNDATELSEIQKLEKERAAALAELDLLEATWIEKARIAAYYQGLINEETTLQNKEANDKQKEDDEKLQDAKFRVASQTIDAISSIGKLFAGENEKNAKIAFKISKAVGIAQAGINTSQAIMKAASETTDVTPTQSLRTANMIAMGVAGAAQIASIAAQKFEGGSDTVPKPSMGGGSQAPAFNVVGASGETQLADAIGSQTQRPARAYVVSNDVTTAQEMDRNIIEGASIG